MKLLIIAGPYEADRIRRAAVAAGFETVAVEPGESLSGWITASRPDLIVMAPQIVNPDPAVAVNKVRSVPRGRVPIFLVGEAGDEAKTKDLGADGFFVRPVSTADLVARARALLGVSSSGEHAAVPSVISEGHTGELGRPAAAKSGPTTSSGQAPKAPPTLKPLVAAGDTSGPVAVKARHSEAGAMFVKLAESIDATLEAEMQDVARSVGALRRDAPAAAPAPRKRGELERTPMAPMTALAAAAALPHAEAPPLVSPESEDGAVEELQDDAGQKTVEVPRDVFARMMHERTNATRAPDAGGPAPVESGKIADTDVAALFGRVVVERLTGRMVLRNGTSEKVVYFDRGAPTVSASNDHRDRMGEMLVRQGRLTDAQQARGVEALATSGRRIGSTLARLGIIKLSELPAMVRRHYEEIIHSVFAWEEGEWALGPERPPQIENVILSEHPAALILEGIRRKYGAGRLRRCLGGGAQIFRLPASAGTSELLSRMRLTHEERDLVPYFDGVRTLDEVCALTEAPDEVGTGVAWALSVMGRLERVETRREEPAPAEDGSSGNGQRDAAPPPPERDVEIDRARVLSRHALVEEADYFQVLGVPRTASTHEVRRAHRELMREFAPTTFDSGLADELGSELRAIRAVLDEALRVLGEPKLRERYQTRLPAPARRTAE
jgi:hypothetical protein